ncbi:MAG: PKD domain-containing protein, partial [Candidatus Thermoplasmatota archaeon]|nr:PKD domain-containing protein [Candidatus Thermoplasmatota archaeon]
MTLLSLAGNDNALAPVLLLALALATAGMAGCIGNDDDETPGPEAFRVFLAATGTSQPATANVSSIGVLRADTGATQFIQMQANAIDLADLATSGQARLAAASTDINTSVTQTVVKIQRLTIGDETLNDLRLEVPLTYQAGPGTEATVTLDLDATAENGELTLAHLVIEKGSGTLASITAAELAASQREQIVPLAQPTIEARAMESNDPAPSFHVNDPSRFEVDIRENESAKVREVFWSFSDGSTTSGRNVTHTFRQAGPASASVIVEGTRGQQARTNLTLDIYFTTEG